MPGPLSTEFRQVARDRTSGAAELALRGVAAPGSELVFDSRTLFEGNLYTYEDYEINQRVVAPMDFVAEELGEVMEEMKSRHGFELRRLGIE